MADSVSTVVHGTAGEPVELPIAQAGTTCYSWTLDLPAGVTRIEDGAPRAVPDGQRLGAAAGGMIRVTAVKGRFRIAARLARPWEPDNPVRTVAIDLIVD